MPVSQSVSHHHAHKIWVIKNSTFFPLDKSRPQTTVEEGGSQ